jgi:hypothetical protein
VRDALRLLRIKGFKRAWPPCWDEALGERRLTLIKMDEAVKARVEKLFDLH